MREDQRKRIAADPLFVATFTNVREMRRKQTRNKKICEKYKERGKQSGRLNKRKKN